MNRKGAEGAERRGKKREGEKEKKRRKGVLIADLVLEGKKYFECDAYGYRFATALFNLR